MAARHGRVLAISAGSGRMGYVLIVRGELVGWKLSRKAAGGTEAAASTFRLWIASLEPSILLTEHPESVNRKGARTRAVLRVLAQVARDEAIPSIAAKRIAFDTNKYLEAAALADIYPIIAPLVPPPRRAWQPEPRIMTCFEALALAHQVFGGEL